MPPNNVIIGLRRKFHLPECWVMVKKLSVQRMTRMSVNPFTVVFRCGRCNGVMHNGPKCGKCKRLYHYDCALLKGECCNLNILPPPETLVPLECGKCKKAVQFGHKCTLCLTMFHNKCLTAFERCCKKIIYARKNKCGICREIIEVGPKCPFCGTTYHFECIDNNFKCCNNRLDTSGEANYACKRCKKKVVHGTPMCLFCGEPSHISCLNRSHSCCGKKITFDVYFIPSFKHFVSINVSLLCDAAYSVKKRKRRQSMPVLQREAPVKYKRPTPPALESTSSEHPKEAKRSRRNLGPPVLELGASKTNLTEDVRNKRMSLPVPLLVDETRDTPPDEDANFADRIRIIAIKTEEPEEEDPSLPILQRQDVNHAPGTSFGEMRRLLTPSLVFSNSSDRSEEPDPMESLFYFLYNSVKKLPPELQNRVKLDLFKIVTQAEMESLQQK